jgi:hypothetical protein
MAARALQPILGDLVRELRHGVQHADGRAALGNRLLPWANHWERACYENWRR